MHVTRRHDHKHVQTGTDQTAARLTSQGTGPVDCLTGQNDTVALPGFECNPGFVLNNASLPNTCDFIECDASTQVRYGDACKCQTGVCLYRKIQLHWYSSVRVLGHGHVSTENLGTHAHTHIRVHPPAHTHAHPHACPHTPHHTGSWGDIQFTNSAWSGACTACTPIAHASNPNNTVSCDSADTTQAILPFVCDDGYILAHGPADQCIRMWAGLGSISTRLQLQFANSVRSGRHTKRIIALVPVCTAMSKRVQTIRAQSLPSRCEH